MVRGIEDERLSRMLNWLEFQKRFGYQKIKLYLFQVSDQVERVLTEHGENLGLSLDLVDYRFSYESLCRHQISLYEENRNSSLRKSLLDACTNFVSYYFDPRKDTVVNSHEKVCTNDCLSNFKYEYEFMTNFDFDELLLPRKIMINNYSALIKESNTSNYDIYEYASDLVRKYGSNIASFRFEHVLFLDHFDYEFLKNVFSKLSQVIYKYYKNQETLQFRIQIEDELLIGFLRESQQLVLSLNETIWKKSKIDEIWNRPYAINLQNRLGKSLFVSKWTEMCNQHTIEYRSGDSEEKVLPLVDGFSSHFRELIEGFFTGALMDFNRFLLDLEYYKFLANF